ncbi:Gar1 [Symbiodinium sp. CCMP2592]|nr:Gar1 [Symbiodinium sp. CCMP2592]
MRRQARKSCLRGRSTQKWASEPSESSEDKQSCHWNKEEAALFLQSQVGSEGIGCFWMHWACGFWLARALDPVFKSPWCGPLLPNLEGLLSAFEPQLRRWPQLSEEEKSSDPFAQCLLGPFEHDAGHGQMACYYYDLENERTQFSENSLGLLVLSLPAVAQILKDVETQVESLMELRILRDLSVARTNQHVRARLRSQPSRPRGRRLKDRSKRFGKNLVGLFNQKRPAKHGESWSPIPHSSSEEGLSPGGGNDNDTSVGETPPQSAFVVESGDRTLRAMAGKHARDFVPERLPWQILCRMTRVCQLTWAMCGVMVLLKELGLVQVDFQQGSARALAAPEPLVLEEVRLDWPNGTLFLPAMLHCPASSVEPLLLASPTSLFLGSHLPQIPTVPVQFEFLAAVRLPQGATWLSTGEGRGHTGLERLALLAPGKGCLRWPADHLVCVCVCVRACEGVVDRSVAHQP